MVRFLSFFFFFFFRELLPMPGKSDRLFLVLSSSYR